jgi:NAD(P)H-dependent FMN reductase
MRAHGLGPSMTTRLMIIVGSVRPGRAALPVAEWVRSVVDADERFEVDWVDLEELGLPFMDEPQHPAKRQYEHDHTIAWSERVDAADAFVLVAPEYNHSFSPVLKNALDFLSQEWWRKPYLAVSYGGVSSGTRAAAALIAVTSQLGLVKTVSSVEIGMVRAHIADGRFEATTRDAAKLELGLDELAALAPALAALRKPAAVGA